jgi:hypothetical protein
MGNYKALLIITAVMPLLAIPQWWPYGYYQILRWVVTIIAGLVSLETYENHLPIWTFILVAIALLFNPIIPVYLDKATWVPIDFIVSILFFYAAHSLRVKDAKK